MPAWTLQYRQTLIHAYINVCFWDFGRHGEMREAGEWRTNFLPPEQAGTLAFQALVSDRQLPSTPADRRALFKLWEAHGIKPCSGGFLLAAVTRRQPSFGMPNVTRLPPTRQALTGPDTGMSMTISPLLFKACKTNPSSWLPRLLRPYTYLSVL